MLQQLHIRNYAIITDLSISFDKGLNIITGETGAGKSIIIGALGLVLGNRSDTSVLYNNKEKCVVEAVFTANQSENIIQFFTENDLDIDAQIIVRREISPNGKSRGFINDTPVNLIQMRGLALLLVDLHTQFDTQHLDSFDFQMNVLDALANNAKLNMAYKTIYKQWYSAKQKLTELYEKQLNFKTQQDYNQFLVDELVAADFKENEIEQLDEELLVLANAETINTTLGAATFALSESEEPLVQQIKVLANQLSSLSGLKNQIGPLVERLQQLHIELQDIAYELQRTSDNITVDPERLQLIEDRLDLANKLLKKHQLNSTTQLLALQEQLEEKLLVGQNIDEDIQKLEIQIGRWHAELIKNGAAITAKRQMEALPLKEKTERLLNKVGMPNAQIKINISPKVEPGLHGLDEIEFLFDANKTNRFEPIGKVASGGELSRLMLSIKSIVAGSLQLPTLIFDEIDSGISGEAASQVAIILKTMAKHHQMICITHQPQIAAKANAHFYIYKQQENNTIRTSVRQLSDSDRVEAIAQMMGGELKSEHTLKAAREMIGSEV